MSNNRWNLKKVFMSTVSLLDEAIVVVLVIFVLSRFGIHTPIWVVVLVAAAFIGWATFSYVAMKKNPQLGFENMVGASGITVDCLSPKGTVRIGHELWAAMSREGKIEVGVAVVVNGQSGLLLSVVRKELSPSSSISSASESQKTEVHRHI
jgi:membrane-bound ClpP family serine protease